MTHARRLLLALALTSAALVPLFSTELPRSADGRPHVYRIVLFAQHLRQGEWQPRYSPELVYGYGYPLFNYYAPLTYSLGAALHGLGLSAIVAFHMLLALALLLGAWGAWTLAAEWFESEPAGALAAAVSVYTPYTLFNIYTRGAAPEQLAVALLPWLLWSLSRALRSPSPPALIRLALLYAALLLTHNLTALVGTAILGVWAVAETIGRLRAEGRNFQTAHLPLVTASLAIGLALSALFWLPAFGETSAVQVSQLTAPATLDFRNYFLTPDQLLTSTFTFDPRLEPPTIPVAFGLSPLMLAILGLVVSLRQPNAATRVRGLTLAVLLVGFLALTLAVSRPLWEALAPLKLIQFPWRFLGPATVCAALLAGAITMMGRQPAPRVSQSSGAGSPKMPPMIAALIVFIALLALPWTFVTRFPPAQLPPQPAVADIFVYEVESGGFGLTSTGEFLPAGVTQLPPAAAAWAKAVMQGTAERLDRSALPPSVVVQGTATARLSAEARFQAEQPFDATFRWFYFPGWQAEVDGQPAPVRASEPFGFITVPVPAGAHVVRVFFGGTPLRQFAAVLSLIGLAGLLALPRFARRLTPATPHAPHAPPRSTLYFLLAALSLFALRLSLDDVDSPWRRSRFDGQTIAGAAQTLDLYFGEQLRLIGFDPPAPTPADRPLVFTLYWTLPERADTDYSIAAQLWDAEGHLVGQQDSQHPNGAPTTRWLAGGYAADAHALTPYPGTPAGEYRLMIGVYPARGPNVEVRDADGLPLGRFYEAARVVTLPPTRPPTETELAPTQLMRAPLGPIELIGVDGLRPQVMSGDELTLVLYWRNEAEKENLRLEIELAGAQNWRLSQLPVPAGRIVRQPYSVLISPEAAGPAELHLSLLDSTGERLAGPVTLDRLEVSVPARSFELPAIPSPLNRRFGSSIELVGYGLSAERLSPGQPLEVTLYWRAVAPMARRYTVSVQLLDEQGQIAAQTDAEPGQGQRPTTGWLPPEIITDVYVLATPTTARLGAYDLQVVVYDPRTGERLPLNPVDTALLLQKIELQP